MGDNETDLKFRFEELQVYQKALVFIDLAYDVTVKFPKEEKFGLSSQFQRAAYSIALNVAEGSGGTKAEFQQFIRIARRSVRECVVCLTIANRRGYITGQQESDMRKSCSVLSRMLSGLLNSLK